MNHVCFGITTREAAHVVVLSTLQNNIWPSLLRNFRELQKKSSFCIGVYDLQAAAENPDMIEAAVIAEMVSGNSKAWNNDHQNFTRQTVREYSARTSIAAASTLETLTVMVSTGDPELDTRISKFVGSALMSAANGPSAASIRQTPISNDLYTAGNAHFIGAAMPLLGSNN